MNKRLWVIILGLWIALLIFPVFLAGWYVVKNEFTQPHFATFSEATQRFEEGDAIVGSQTNMDADVIAGIRVSYDGRIRADKDAKDC